MNNISQRLLLIMGTLSLAGCGPSASTSIPPKIAERADVIVTVDGGRHACVVALYKEPQGSAVPCGEVVSFIRDELRVASGGIYDVHTIPEVDEAELDRVVGNLRDAGYRFIGGRELNALAGSQKHR